MTPPKRDICAACGRIVFSGSGCGCESPHIVTLTAREAERLRQQLAARKVMGSVLDAEAQAAQKTKAFHAPTPRRYRGGR